MKIAIMQPYFLPYIGYFQLINAVDKFVIYDNIQYTKKGWINRNRILQNGKDVWITLPLRQASDFLEVSQRELAADADEALRRQTRVVKEAYQKAPYFEQGFQVYLDCISINSINLFDFIFHTVQVVCGYLNIHTEIIISSTLPVADNLKGVDRVIGICKALQADTYINPIGGTSLYRREEFAENHIQLYFLQPDPIQYRQFDNEFVPWLSILDLVMFNSVEKVREYLKSCMLV